MFFYTRALPKVYIPTPFSRCFVNLPAKIRCRSNGLTANFMLAQQLPKQSVERDVENQDEPSKARNFIATDLASNRHNPVGSGPNSGRRTSACRYRN